MHEIRRYDATRDRDAAGTIWKEVGWVDGSKDDAKVMDAFLEGADLWVGIQGERPECLVATDLGDMRYLHDDLSYALVTAVTTSRIARRQGLAGQVTAHALAERAAQGAAIAGLGMFDQGYYDKLGFATGAYEHCIHMAPSMFEVPYAERPPQRLDKSNLDAIIAGRLRRRRSHGNVNIARPGLTLELLMEPKAFGLGFFDQDVLTHHMWIRHEDAEHGPYRVQWIAYETQEQLLELLGVLKNLGDQIDNISMWETDDLQLQRLLRRPFQGMRQTRGAKHPQKIASSAWWQARVLDLDACAQAFGRASRDELRFNLTVHDPISSKLPDTSPWRGVGGDYTLHLARGEAALTPGHTTGLEILEADVGALTRWWLGVSSAWSLCAEPGFQASQGLVEVLDEAILLPAPRVGWLL